jgi:hypothetical protein
VTVAPNPDATPSSLDICSSTSSTDSSQILLFLFFSISISLPLSPPSKSP